jgi:hypothetical protein
MSEDKEVKKKMDALQQGIIQQLEAQVKDSELDLQDDLAAWRRITIKCASKLQGPGWDTAASDISQEIFSLLTPIFTSISPTKLPQQVTTELRSSLLVPYQDVLKFTLLVKGCRDLFRVHIPTPGKKYPRSW